MKFSTPLIVLLLAIAPNLQAQENSLAPYFEVLQGAGSSSDFPLLHTAAEVQVVGIIAEVAIRQSYHNSGKKPIEARYVFPGSTRAAVHGMEMHIGDRHLRAQIQEKEKARQTYQQAQRAGKRASLLEQDRPNIFQMQVANLMPGDTIHTILRYTELLVPEEGIYEFVYPTVVGPRFTGEENIPVMLAAQQAHKGIPYSLAGEAPTYTFGFQMNIQGGMPMQKVSSPSHKIETNWLGNTETQISLHPSEQAGGNRDLIIQYALRGKKIQSGLLKYEGKEENNFLLMVQPPERIAVAEISPREYIFVVDVSGSMHGYPLDLTKSLMGKLLQDLRPQDRFNVMVFSGRAGFLAEQSIPVTRENVDRAIRDINSLQGGGGTRLLHALTKALAVPKTDGYSRSFVMLTDGYVSVEPEAFELIRQQVGEANFFTFGIGKSVNRHLLEGVARAGKGEPFVVTDHSEGEQTVERFRKYVESPVLTDIEIQLEGIDAYDILPAKYPDLLGERPLIVMGKYRSMTKKASITIKGNSTRGKFQKEVSFLSPKQASEKEAIQYLWARSKIQLLNDHSYSRTLGDEVKAEITALGLRYHLLTNYTSFVAVDNEVVNPTGAFERKEQVIPLPDQVQNTAVAPLYLNKAKSNASFGVPPPPPPPPPESEEIFTVVEEMPRFPGCESIPAKSERQQCANEEMLRFIYKHLKWPASPEARGSSTVVVRFSVMPDGSIEQIRILRGISAEVDAEVIRVIELMPKWIPGRQRGRAVKVGYNLPIKVCLE